jgi:hypothetical protein
MTEICYYTHETLPVDWEKSVVDLATYRPKKAFLDGWCVRFVSFGLYSSHTLTSLNEIRKKITPTAAYGDEFRVVAKVGFHDPSVNFRAFSSPSDLVGTVEDIYFQYLANGLQKTDLDFYDATELIFWEMAQQDMNTDDVDKAFQEIYNAFICKK